MKDRTSPVASVEAIPRKILFAAHIRPFDPAQASNRNDVGAGRHEGPGLLGVGPVRFDQQPGREDARQVPDQGVHERAHVGRVSDAYVGVAEVRNGECILAIRNVAPIGAAEPEDSRWRTSAPSPQHGSANERTPRRYGISGSTAAAGSGKSRAGFARSWIACPSHLASAIGGVRVPPSRRTWAAVWEARHLGGTIRLSPGGVPFLGRAAPVSLGRLTSIPYREVK